MEPLLAVLLLIGIAVTYDQEAESVAGDTSPKAIKYQYKDVVDGSKTVSTGDQIKYGVRVKHWVAGENYYISDLSLHSLPEVTELSSGDAVETQRSAEPYNPVSEYDRQISSHQGRSKAHASVQARQVASIPQHECKGKTITVLTSDLDTPREDKNQMHVREAVLRCS